MAGDNALAVLAAHGHHDPDCSCNHLLSEHRGKCRGLDSYGQPCTCPSFDLDQFWQEQADGWGQEI